MELKKLSDIAEVQTDTFGSQLHNEDYVTTGTPIVTVEHLGNRQFSTQNLPLVSDDDTKRLVKYTLQEGDIVFSRVGSVDRCSYVTSSENGWLFSGRCLRVRCGNNCYQTHIASILSSIDDKIELNRKINDNLEQQSQALFKSWFVDNPNWDETNLSEVANFIGGYSYKGEE